MSGLENIHAVLTTKDDNQATFSTCNIDCSVIISNVKPRNHEMNLFSCHPTYILKKYVVDKFIF